MTTQKKRIVPCPQCGNDAEYSPDNKYRPFCTEHCKLIDLGDWAEENYRIPEKTPTNVDENQH